MSILTYGINHKTAPIEIRERVAFNPLLADRVLQDLMTVPAVSEAVLVSTCNRTEIYSVAENDAVIKDWMHQQHVQSDLSDFCYSYQGIDSIKHLLRVASGLDSMILGEPQIFGQIKQAYQLACNAGSVGKHLRHLFPAVFAASKEIRYKTEIGDNAISVAYAACKMARQVFSDLDNREVLLIGAGEMIELMATHLHGRVRRMLCANRTPEKSRKLTALFQAIPIRMGDIPALLANVDIVITATASQLPIIGKGMIESALRQKSSHQLFMVDLAVPRDIESEAGELDGVYLYNIDDLQGVVDQNLDNRRRAAKKAEAMIDLKAADYIRQLRVMDAGDMIRNYRGQLELLRDQELLKAKDQLKNGQDPDNVLQQMAHNLINKVMHQPTVKIRQAALREQIDMLMFAKDLFELKLSE